MNEHWVQLETVDNHQDPRLAVTRTVCKCGWVSHWQATDVEAVDKGLTHTDTAVSVSPVTGPGRSGSPE